MLAGGALAAVGFVAAQAGSLDFVKIELAHLAHAIDDKPVVAQASRGAHRSYSTASAGREQPGMPVTASRASGSVVAGGLDSGSDSAQATGEATNDAVDLFGFSPVAMPMAQAASNDPLRFGDRFHGLVDGVSSGSQRPSDGGASGGRGAQKALADCCDDPTTQQDKPLLTAPTLLADGASGPAPETGAWTLMILGFGLSGLVLRGERRRWA
jgi:hypothetical protein